MKNLRTAIMVGTIALTCFSNLQAQTHAKTNSNIKLGGMNEMPNTLRTSMNVSIGKQTLNVAIVEGGCVIASPNQAYAVKTATHAMTEISRAEFGDRVNAGKQTQGVTFGDRVNAGLQQAGSVVSQGASIVSAAVSSVSNMANAGGASSAAYASTGKSVWHAGDNEKTFQLPNNLPDGDYEFSFIIVEKATSGLKDTLKTQVRMAFNLSNGVLKTKHDTAKNSISNIR